MQTEPTDPAARLAALQAAETKALAAVSTAAAALTRKQDKHREVRERHEAEERVLTERLEAAQGAYASAAGPERAAIVLGVSVTVARQLAKSHDADSADDDPQQPQAHQDERHAGPEGGTPWQAPA